MEKTDYEKKGHMKVGHGELRIERSIFLEYVKCVMYISTVLECNPGSREESSGEMSVFLNAISKAMVSNLYQGECCLITTSHLFRRLRYWLENPRVLVWTS
jgi:hypothetical protein